VETIIHYILNVDKINAALVNLKDLSKTFNSNDAKPWSGSVNMYFTFNIKSHILNILKIDIS